MGKTVADNFIKEMIKDLKPYLNNRLSATSMTKIKALVAILTEHEIPYQLFTSHQPF